MRGREAVPSDWLVGRKPVRELLEGAGAARAEKLLLSEDLPGPIGRPLAELARRHGVVVQRAPRQSLDRIAAGAAHQGVALRVGARAVLSVEDLFEQLPERPLVLLCDRVEDPRNLGAMIRSAAAAGADAVVFPERRSAGLTAGAAKAAAGALERIPIARAGSVAKALAAFGSAGLRCVGLDAAGTCVWDGSELAGPTCLVVGGEERGLSRLVRERCDALISFPLFRGVESLNAAVAASLALYEARRQRRAQETK